MTRHATHIQPMLIYMKERRRRRYRGDRYIKHRQATQQYRSSAMLTTIRLSWKLKENPRKNNKTTEPKTNKRGTRFWYGKRERQGKTIKNQNKSHPLQMGKSGVFFYSDPVSLLLLWLLRCFVVLFLFCFFVLFFVRFLDKDASNCYTETVGNRNVRFRAGQEEPKQK